MGLIDSFKQAFSKPCKTISVAQAKELLGSGATLIDVRSAQEWRTGRAPQAKHVLLDRLQTSQAGIQRTRPVIAVCASGVRSASAARLLAAKGYNAYSLRGGMAAWRQAGEAVRQQQPTIFRTRIQWLKSPSPKPSSAVPPPASSMSARTSKSRKA